MTNSQIAFDAARKIMRLIPREIQMHIGFEGPVKRFTEIIEEAIEAAIAQKTPETTETELVSE